VKCIKLLADAGADLNLQDKEGERRQGRGGWAVTAAFTAVYNWVLGYAGVCSLQSDRCPQFRTCGVIGCWVLGAQQLAGEQQSPSCSATCNDSACPLVIGRCEGSHVVHCSLLMFLLGCLLAAF
jgi:hypothetical protein